MSTSDRYPSIVFMKKQVELPIFFFFGLAMKNLLVRYGILTISVGLEIGRLD